ncbi:MAG: ATP-binding cassette domain-containing protein [Gammaproteobacteria bacterium]|nr:ATP-binding cassette domain-containing protein [Gammaproteobacteria bacterium]
MLVVDVIFLCLFFLCLVLVSAKLTMGAFAFIAMLIMTNVLFAPILEKKYSSTYRSLSLYQSGLVETIQGMESIKTLSVGIKFQGMLEDRLTNYLGRDFSRRTVSNFFETLSNFFNRAAEVYVILFGAYLVILGDLTLGQLIAFHLLLGQIQAPLTRIAHMVDRVFEIKVAFRQIGILFSSEIQERNSGESMPLGNLDIRLDDISYQYTKDGKQILSSVSLEIPHGGKIAILGDSGTGKSTLAKLIGGLLEPTNGNMYFGDLTTDMLSPESIRASISHASQDSTLFAGSVAENISMGVSQPLFDDIVSAAKSAELHEFIIGLPEKYETQLEERGANLSGGQRQRVVLAREFARKNKIMIVDEATNAIDKDTETKIFRNLASSNSTVIYISHNKNLLQYADWIIQVQEGSVTMLAGCKGYE